MTNPIESLDNAAFQPLTEEDAREVLGGLALIGAGTTATGKCILDGQAVNDYETDN